MLKDSLEKLTLIGYIEYCMQKGMLKVAGRLPDGVLRMDYGTRVLERLAKEEIVESHIRLHSEGARLIDGKYTFALISNMSMCGSACSEKSSWLNRRSGNAGMKTCIFHAI